jgi:hypothetical protein
VSDDALTSTATGKERGDLLNDHVGRQTGSSRTSCSIIDSNATQTAIPMFAGSSNSVDSAPMPKQQDEDRQSGRTCFSRF